MYMMMCRLKLFSGCLGGHSQAEQQRLKRPWRRSRRRAVWWRSPLWPGSAPLREWLLLCASVCLSWCLCVPVCLSVCLSVSFSPSLLVSLPLSSSATCTSKGIEACNTCKGALQHHNAHHDFMSTSSLACAVGNSPHSDHLF